MKKILFLAVGLFAACAVLHALPQADGLSLGQTVLIAHADGNHGNNGGNSTSSSTITATSTLIIATVVTNGTVGTSSASDFTDFVTGTNIVPSSTVLGAATGA